MSNFLIFGVFQMIFTQKVLNVIKAGFHRSWLIYYFELGPTDAMGIKKLSLSDQIRQEHVCMGFRDTWYLPFYFQGYRTLSIFYFTSRDMGSSVQYFGYFQLFK